MRKIKILGIILAVGAMAFTLSDCAEEEPLESCAQEEICTAKSVTTCCTATSCVYKYNDQEYTEDQLDQLVDDLGCGDGGARVAAEQRTQLIHRLQALMAEARAGLH